MNKKHLSKQKPIKALEDIIGINVDDPLRYDTKALSTKESLTTFTSKITDQLKIFSTSEIYIHIYDTRLYLK